MKRQVILFVQIISNRLGSHPAQSDIPALRAGIVGMPLDLKIEAAVEFDKFLDKFIQLSFGLRGQLGLIKGEFYFVIFQNFRKD